MVRVLTNQVLYYDWFANFKVVRKQGQDHPVVTAIKVQSQSYRRPYNVYLGGKESCTSLVVESILSKLRLYFLAEEDSLTSVNEINVIFFTFQ